MFSTDRMRPRQIHTALGASVLVAMLTGCAASSNDDGATDQRPTQGTDAAVEDPTSFATVEIHADGSLTIPFAQPTLQQFLLHPAVANIVIGTIESSRAHVDQTEGGHDVFTTSQVAVESSALPTSKVITLSTLGGTVPLRDVRSDFEGRPEQPELTSADLDKMVTYQVNGASQPRAGERVLVVLTKDGGTLLDLVLQGDQYEWRGKEAPNPAWTDTVSAAEVVDLIATLKKARS